MLAEILVEPYEECSLYYDQCVYLDCRVEGICMRAETLCDITNCVSDELILW